MLTPVAKSNAMPVDTKKIGAATFTEAKASLPTPLPTKMPSAKLEMAEKINPINVGINNFTNKRGTFIVPKSRTEFRIFIWCLSLGHPV